jgi:hypothetical protein
MAGHTVGPGASLRRPGCGCYPDRRTVTEHADDCKEREGLGRFNLEDHLKTHRLLNLATALSLLLGAAVAVLWARSYRGCDALVRPARAGDRACVTSEFGVVVFEWEAATPGAVQPGWEYFPSPLPRRWPVRRGLLGPEAYRGTVRHFVRLPPAAVYGLAVPHWLLFLAAATLPCVGVLRRWRGRVRLRRLAAGQCGRCGYDLRASPGRCPECGSGAGGVRAVSP